MKTGEGWGFPMGSRKAHYFRETMALCRRYGLYAGSVEPEQAEPSPDDCAACRKKLDREKKAVAADREGAK